MNKPNNRKIEIMGILNCTPDSFSDGGRFMNIDALKSRIDEIASDETDIIDIGGESSRPGAQQVPVDEEWRRIEPAILYCKKNYPNLKISIDTVKSEIAVRSIDAGADIINDISGGDYDPLMVNSLSKTGIPIIIMHMKGTPLTMQNNPDYQNVVAEISEYLAAKISICDSLNVKVYAVDPGIGFGKTPEHNRLILNNLDTFTSFNLPLLIGISRKSLFKSLFDLEVTERDIPSALLESMLLFKGASIIRTHNTRNGYYIKKLFGYLGHSYV